MKLSRLIAALLMGLITVAGIVVIFVTTDYLKACRAAFVALLCLLSVFALIVEARLDQLEDTIRRNSR